MSRRQRIIGIVIGVFLLTMTSWAQEEISPSCWQETLEPIYFCRNTLTGATRFVNWTTGWHDRGVWIPTCRKNEILIERFVIVRESPALKLDFEALNELDR